jgi:hypothetical protein
LVVITTTTTPLSLTAAHEPNPDLPDPRRLCHHRLFSQASDPDSSFSLAATAQAVVRAIRGLGVGELKESYCIDEGKSYSLAVPGEF